MSSRRRSHPCRRLSGSTGRRWPRCTGDWSNSPARRWSSSTAPRHSPSPEILQPHCISLTTSIYTATCTSIPPGPICCDGSAAPTRPGRPIVERSSWPPRRPNGDSRPAGSTSSSDDLSPGRTLVRRLYMSDNKAVFKRFDDAVSTGDLDRIAKTIDEVFHPDVLISTPLPVEATGAEALKQVWAMLLRAYPDLHVTVEDVIADGDKVVVRNTVTGTHQGTYMGLAPTGKTITYVEIFILRFVYDAPCLRDAAVDEAEDEDLAVRDGLAGRRQPHVRALMGAGDRVPDDHLVAVGDHVLDRDVQVGVGAQQHRPDLLEGFCPGRLDRQRRADEHVGVEDLVDRLRDAVEVAGTDRIVEALEYRFVVAHI